EQRVDGQGRIPRLPHDRDQCRKPYLLGVAGSHHAPFLGRSILCPAPPSHTSGGCAAPACATPPPHDWATTRRVTRPSAGPAAAPSTSGYPRSSCLTLTNTR